MCGRFAIKAKPEELAERFDAEVPEEELFPQLNAAPTQRLPVIPNDSLCRIQLFRWGLIPSWAKDPAIGSKMFNARAETIVEKPSFRSAFQKRRCLVLADAFYEWQKTPQGKVPLRISLKSDAPFAFAGLWETWHSPDGSIIPTFTIITTEPNDLLAPIHNRMPVIMDPQNEKVWLDNTLSQNDWLHTLQTFPSQNLKIEPATFLMKTPPKEKTSLFDD